jgi:hypothetical protein
MTICKYCKHMRHDIKNRQAPDVWYNFFCSASRREKAQDPVTGEWGFLSKNSLGEINIVEEEFEYCRYVNKGDCPKFEALHS